MHLYQVFVKREFAEDNISDLIVAENGQQAEAMVRREYELSDDYDVVYITKITEVCGYNILLVPKRPKNRELCYA